MCVVQTGIPTSVSVLPKWVKFPRSDDDFYPAEFDKTIYDCSFTFYMDGRFYNNNYKRSVFDPKAVFGKIEAEFTQFVKSFL